MNNNIEDVVKNSEKKKSKSLDGGWGWFACLGSSLITVISLIKNKFLFI